jgi:hypothetical protein
VGGAQAVARVGQQRAEQEGDEDAPLHSDRRLDQAFLAPVGLVELAEEDQEHHPQAGARDDGAVAAGQVERLALGPRPQQRDHADHDDEDRRLDERVDAERALGVVDPLEVAADDRVAGLLVPGEQHRQQQQERGDRRQALLARERAPVAADPAEHADHAGPGGIGIGGAIQRRIVCAPLYG